MSGLQEQWRADLTLSEALMLAVAQLTRDSSGGPPRTLGTSQLEVAILDRLRPRRAFRRLAGPLLERLLTPGDPTTDVPHTDDGRPGLHDTLTEVEPPTGDGPAAGKAGKAGPRPDPAAGAARPPDDHEPGDHDLGGEG
jgi:proteasome alpha subunit